MSTVRITIIGLGPRGLGILQRLARDCRDLPADLTVEVHVVDPAEEGQGAHSSRQPDYLLTNTLACQLSMFSDGSGPSFADWAQQAGYRRFGSAYLRTGGDAGEPIGEFDYLPRKLLGEYLSFVFDQTVAALPPGMHVVHHRSWAVDIEEYTATSMLVRLAKGYEITSDFVFLATGHSRRFATGEDLAAEQFVNANRYRNDRLGYFASPYPIDVLQSIAPGSVVAVQGIGLTAHDVIAALTTGRGGRFTGTGSEMTYQPSGREPEILLFSRQCLPAAARGINQKGVARPYQAHYFTPEAIQKLRRAKGSRQLDFGADVVPLLLREMGHAYRCALEQRELIPAEYEFGPEDRRVLDEIMNPLSGRGFADLDEFQAYFTAFVTDDLAEAERGNLDSPVKAATDAIRDTREALREAVDFAGLTPESHQEFVGGWVPLMNRITFGPPRTRNYELLALMRANVVGLAGGPGCVVRTDERSARFTIETTFTSGVTTRYADALVSARLDLFHPREDASPLTGQLLARGLIRPFANGGYRPGGLDITPTGRVIAESGQPLHGVWALGCPVEGPRYYTYYVPRANQRARFTVEADAAVDDMWAQFADTNADLLSDRVRSTP